jgi:hypothetical protein
LRDIAAGEELTIDYRWIDAEFGNLDRDVSIGVGAKKAA